MKANTLKNILAVPAALVLALGLSSTAMADGHGKKHKDKMDAKVVEVEAAMKKDIVDTAVGAGQFNTLAAALTAAGLVDTLKGEGPFTVFAPTDEAFAKLPKGTVESLLLPENKDKLVAILTYHVVPGKVNAAQVVNLTSAATVNGDTVDIKVKKGAVTIDAANVIKTDIGATNGVIHVIDSVIMPN